MSDWGEVAGRKVVYIVIAGSICASHKVLRWSKREVPVEALQPGEGSSAA